MSNKSCGNSLKFDFPDISNEYASLQNFFQFYFFYPNWFHAHHNRNRTPHIHCQSNLNEFDSLGNINLC